MHFDNLQTSLKLLKLKKYFVSMNNIFQSCKKLFRNAPQHLQEIYCEKMEASMTICIYPLK